MLVPSGVIGPQIPPSPMTITSPVIIEGMPAAYVGCTCVCTGVISAGIVHPPPPTPPPPIVLGSFTVLIHGMPAARWAPSGDIGGCGAFLGMPTLMATRRVFIGNFGMGGPTSAQGQAMSMAKQAAQPFCEVCQKS
ncbi:MAG: PAAR domain-containing protein [Planctomycetota bacterium]